MLISNLILTFFDTFNLPATYTTSSCGRLTPTVSFSCWDFSFGRSVRLVSSVFLLKSSDLIHNLVFIPLLQQLVRSVFSVVRVGFLVTCLTDFPKFLPLNCLFHANFFVLLRFHGNLYDQFPQS